jgi:hypothetical protein
MQDLELLRAEIREEFAALAKYEAEHGSFPDLVRAHYVLASDDIDA